MAVVNITANTADDSITKGGQASWAAARDAASGTLFGVASANYYAISTGGGTYRVDRIFMYFDVTTANIPAGATIVSATLTGKTGVDWTNTDTTSLTLVAGTPADPDSIVDDDFDQRGSTSFGTVTPSGASVDYTITLNASGVTQIINAIAGTGKAIYAIITGRDFDNSAPTGLNQLHIASADNTTAANRPKLNVTYTVGGAAAAGYAFII